MSKDIFAAKPLVSVVVLTYNSADFILLCLEALELQTYENREVIVVDNASSDGTLRVVEESAYNPKVVRSERNLGCAGGNNLGWRAAKGEIIVFLNPDAVPRKEWLENLVAPFLSRSDVVITGSKLYYPNSHRIQHAGGILYPNAMCDHFGNGELDHGQYDTQQEVDYVTGAAIAVRRDFLQALGGLDEDYFPAYYEETDLCFRARRKGFKVLYVPTAVVYHYESPILKKLSRGFYRTFYRSRIRFLMKNYSLRDWLFRFLPFEVKWFLFVPEARGTRLIQFWAYWQGIAFIFRKLFSPRRAGISSRGQKP
jgi:GT2 family glycosyltransferase